MPAYRGNNIDVTRSVLRRVLKPCTWTVAIVATTVAAMGGTRTDGSCAYVDVATSGAIKPVSLCVTDLSRFRWRDASGELEPYFPQPVAVMLNFDVSALRRPSPKLEVLHLHGFTLDSPPIDALITNGGLHETLAEMDDAIVLVAPLSRGRNRDHRNYFNSAKNWNSFDAQMGRYLRFLGIVRPSHRALTAHSGAYRLVAELSRLAETRSRFQSVGLFDATYGAAEELVRLAYDVTQSSGLFWSSIVEHSPTQAVQDQLFMRLQELGLTPKGPPGDTEACQTARGPLREDLDPRLYGHFSVLSRRWGPFVHCAMVR